MIYIKKNGWCPFYNKAFLAKDGYLLRITPNKSSLSYDKAVNLCELSLSMGNGLLDITNRGNIQIRGIKKPNIEKLSKELLKKEITIENDKVKIIISPFWVKNDDNIKFSNIFISQNPYIPISPDKFSIAIDLGASPVLRDVLSDIRLEKTDKGEKILYVDGSKLGRIINEENIVSYITELIKLYNHCISKYKHIKRMSCIVKYDLLPKKWMQIPILKSSRRKFPNLKKFGSSYISKYGRIDAALFLDFLKTSKPTNIRFTPFKSFIFENNNNVEHSSFTSVDNNYELKVYSCPGSNSCSSSSINTHELADRLSYLRYNKIHISGCKKGCALSKPADLTLVGNNGLIDVIFNGKASDKPNISSLTDKQLLENL